MSQRTIQKSVWFLLLSLTASALNFLYYPVVARLLSIQQFGDLQLGVALIMQTAALFTALNIIALYLSAQKNKISRTVLHSMERFIVTTSLIISVLLSLFAPAVAALFGLSDVSVLYLLAVIFICNIPATTWIGVLQGDGQFLSAGIIAVISATTKIIAAVLLVIAGLNVFGALLGILIGQLIVLPLVLLAHKGEKLKISHSLNIVRVPDLVAIKKYSSYFKILLSLAVLAMIGTLDVVVAKAVLAPAVAGYFAQASTLAKIPYYAAIPLTLVLFQQLLTKRSAQIRERTLLSGTLAVLLVIPVLMFIAAPVGYAVLFSGNIPHAIQVTTSLLSAGFIAYIFLTLSLYRMLAERKMKSFFATSIVVGSLGVLFVIVSGIVNTPSPEFISLLFSSLMLFLLISSVIIYQYAERNHE